MQQLTSGRTLARRALPVLLCAVALTSLACDNDVNFNPTVPRFDDLTPVDSERRLEISGSLTTVEGSCLEATVLYDGEELPGARTKCNQPDGCTTLELNAVAHSDPGHHTISFQVVRQSPEALTYVADGQVQVSRVGLFLALTIPLEPQRTTLRPGEGVTYDVQFWN